MILNADLCRSSTAHVWQGLRSPTLRALSLSAAVWVSLVTPIAQARTIEETIKIALSSSPILAEERARRDVLSETVVQSQSAARPAASVTTGTSYDPVNSLGGADLGVNVTLPIWTGGRVKSNVRAALFDVEAGGERLQEIEASVVEGAVTAHADVLFAQEAVEIAEISIGRLDSQIAEAQLRFELGQATLTDVARLRTQRSSVVANLAELRAVLTIAEAQYFAIVGQTAAELSESVEPPIGLPSSLQQALQEGVSENSPFLEQQRIADAAAARIDAARAERLPRVGVTGGLGRSYIIDGNTIDALPFGATFGVTLDVPIITGGLLSSRIREAKAVYRAETFAVEARRREAVRDIEIAWARLEAAKKRLLANRDGLEAAETALRGVSSEYEFGLRTTIDILLAEESLRAAQLAVVQIRSDLLVAQASLLHKMGILSAQSFSNSQFKSN